MRNMGNKEKDTAIKTEIKRLIKNFKDIDDKKKEIVEGLIEEASFMRITLFDLKNQVNSEGATNEMSQGTYSILREHPAAKMYNTMIQRYASVIKQLTELLPKEISKEVDDGFDDFVNNGRD